ncbi:Sigma factor RpoE negative regulatory protein RseB precursor [hydrothermal vent metagenome]|uniref:Sigma factor RpoE negative regulatory protein RseB n=1 Tax=hydrothermal vent metagenome TaxID=652676 RepID=A0A3B1BBE6_9ZZZZ
MRNSGHQQGLLRSCQQATRPLFIVFSVLLPLGVTLADQNQSEVQAWLEKMHTSVHELNYEGIFVYGQHNQLSSMKIYHSVSDKGERERLISMDGSGREVIRDNNKVTCYLPDRNSVVVEKSRPRSNFPPRFPIDINTLQENYTLSLDGKGKVAGYISQKINILPKDKFRYGYHLWVEEKTGLLLKTHLVIEDDTPVEQFMFTQLRFHEKIPEKRLQSGVDSSKFNWHEAPAKKQPMPKKMVVDWQVGKLPAGFKSDMTRMTTLPENLMPVEHLIFTDGLATVSVFIEEMMDSENNLRGGSHMGAVHAFGMALDDHYVTVVGEVPFATVKMIGESVKPATNISKNK